MKRAFIIHGWGGYPEEGWFPWLKKELESKDYSVSIPAMPKPETPEINSWVSTLKEAVGEVDKNTFFVGHSIGCQTIIRFLEEQPEDASIGGAVFVAGWTHLTSEATSDEESKATAKPWIEYPINWKEVRSRTNNFVAIFSTDDPMVPITEKEIFEEKLGAKIIIESNRGHFSGDDGVNELPIILDELNRIVRV